MQEALQWQRREENTGLLLWAAISEAPLAFYSNLISRKKTWRGPNPMFIQSTVPHTQTAAHAALHIRMAQG